MSNTCIKYYIEVNNTQGEFPTHLVQEEGYGRPIPTIAYKKGDNDNKYQRRKYSTNEEEPFGPAIFKVEAGLNMLITKWNLSSTASN